jgi:hypothetical protein
MSEVRPEYHYSAGWYGDRDPGLLRLPFWIETYPTGTTGNRVLVRAYGEQETACVVSKSYAEIGGREYRSPLSSHPRL